MTIKVAINGFGRIGRNILRAYYLESSRRSELEIVAINDLADPETLAHLLNFDSTHGRFPFDVTVSDHHLLIAGDSIPVLNQRDPGQLPWKSLQVDVVFECTGRMTTRSAAQQHLVAGASRVLVSAPGKDLDATVVYGVNHEKLRPSDRLVSNASCTNNCLAPLCQVLDEAFGIATGFMTTVHAYTADQQLIDGPHSDLYRARGAAQSMIPTKTGAATAIGEVLPQLAGKLDGLAVRVPTANVSLVDLTVLLQRTTSVELVNQAMQAAVEADMHGVMSYSSKPLVSIDFQRQPYSCNFDANHTNVSGGLLKVLAWYDNEWAFSVRMLDQALYLGQLSQIDRVA